LVVRVEVVAALDIDGTMTDVSLRFRICDCGSTYVMRQELMIWKIRATHAKKAEI
jgi:hypothetical protein